MSDMDTKIKVFADMMVNTLDVYSWQYDGEGRLIFSNCPFSLVMDNLFSVSGSKSQAFESCGETGLPVLILDSLALSWLAVPYTVNGVLLYVYIIGPIFSSEISEENMLKSIRGTSVPNAWKKELAEHLKCFPVVQHTIFLQYGTLLNYCVTERKILSSDIQISKSGKRYDVPKDELGIHKPHSSFAFEQEIFRAVETGNIQYKKSNYPIIVGKLSMGDPLRQIKNEMIIYISLSARAALRGGLPDKTAYSVCDTYIQMIEEETNPADVLRYGQHAYNDFLQRVYKHKMSVGLSREIHNCLSYIENHLSEKIDFSEMAAELGYSRNYLSSKFTKEMGMTLSNYIVQQRIEFAKIWLRGTRRSISDIAFTLQFGSNSYFSTVFRKAVGVTPSEYRDAKTE